jgi:hypothetical protein
MKTLLFAVLLSATFVVAQDNKATAQDNSSQSKNQITVEGCVTRANGDYVLIKQDPGITYELQASGKVKLHSYLGQRVEITGQKSSSLPTSTDAESRAASPLTIIVSSIKTIDKECPAR